MWQRLKNSLLALSFSALTVLGVTQVGTPADQPTGALPAELMHSAAFRQLDPETRLAVQIAAKLAAVAMDEAVRSAAAANAAKQASPDARVANPRDLRMPFYSFAARSLRNSREI